MSLDPATLAHLDSLTDRLDDLAARRHTVKTAARDTLEVLAQQALRTADPRAMMAVYDLAKQADVGHINQTAT